MFLFDGPYGDGDRRIQLSLIAHASKKRAAACVERGSQRLLPGPLHQYCLMDAYRKDCTYMKKVVYIFDILPHV